MKRKIKYQPPTIAMAPFEQNEQIRRMQTYLEKTREQFKQDMERSKHLGIGANGVLAGPTKSRKT